MRNYSAGARTIGAGILVAAALCHCGGSRETSSARPFEWPPVLGRPYPDVTLIDQEGSSTALSSFKGKVILVEPVGMSCAACQAFSGAHRVGAFEGIEPQSDLRSIEEYMREYGRFNLDDERLVFVQLLLYNTKMKAPTAREGQAWARHFGLDRSRNQVVLVGTPDMVRPESQRMIPGFQLIDKDFVLRFDSTGHQARDDLYKELLPNVKTLVEERREQ